MDPITLLLGAGVLAFVAWARRGKPGGKGDEKCDAGRAGAAVAGAAVSGGAAGMSAGPIGAGVGAGLGLALASTSTFSSPCGQEWIGHAKVEVSKIAKDACKKADAVYAHVKAAGGVIPGYDSMSCDQKLAACLAAASPLGITVVGGVVVAGVAANAVRQINDKIGQATSVRTSLSTRNADVSAGNSNTGASVGTSGGDVHIGGIPLVKW